MTFPAGPATAAKRVVAELDGTEDLPIDGVIDWLGRSTRRGVSGSGAERSDLAIDRVDASAGWLPGKFDRSASGRIGH